MFSEFSPKIVNPLKFLPELHGHFEAAVAQGAGADDLAAVGGAAVARAGDLAENDPLASLWTPGGFVDPERDRQSLSELRPEARELFDYSIARLRDEIGRVTRAEEF